ncbi:MAG: 6-carboxytetrahydropterin synthase [Myxococcota bacterium]
MPITIQKRFHWHMAHRLPDHGGHCRNLHGHTYSVELSVAHGAGVQSAGPQRGMVADFSVLSDVVKEVVMEPLDHALMWWEGDALLSEIAARMARETPPLKMVRTPFTTTAENICAYLAPRLQAALHARDPVLTLTRVDVWETQTSCATWTPR